MLIFCILSLFTFVTLIDVRRRARQLLSSAHSPSRTETEGTTTCTAPNKIEQRGEKLSILMGVIRGALLSIQKKEDIDFSVCLWGFDLWRVKCNAAQKALRHTHIHMHMHTYIHASSRFLFRREYPTTREHSTWWVHACHKVFLCLLLPLKPWNRYEINNKKPNS